MSNGETTETATDGQDEGEATAPAAPTTTAPRGAVRVSSRGTKRPPQSAASTVSFAPEGGSATTGPATPQGPSPGLLVKEANDAYLKQKAELDQMLGSFDFDGGTFSVAVARVEPRFFEGKHVGGHGGTFKRRVDLDEVMNKWGGGTFKFTVLKNGQFVKSSSIDIMGDPIVPSAKNGDIPAGIQTLLQQSIDQSKAREKALEEQIREERKHMAEQQQKSESSLASVLAAVLAPNRKSDVEIEMMREQMKAEREERQRREDALEARREAERKEERRRYEDERREERERREAELKALTVREERIRDENRARMDHEAKMAAAAAAALKAETERREALQREMDKERIAASKENMVFMMKTMQSTHESTTAMMTKVEDMKDKMLERALSKKEDGGFEGLVKAKRLLDELSGNDSDDDGKETWEKVMEKVGEVGPSLLAAAGIGGAAIAGSRQATKEDRLRRRKRRRMLEGSTVVADDSPPEPTEEEKKAAAAKAEQEAADAPPPNDIKRITFPEEGAPIEVVFELLIRDIDFAMEHEYMPSGIVEQVIMKFPEPAVIYMRSNPIEDLIGIVKQRAPATWRINSPGGRKTLREVHALLLKG